MSTAWRNGRSFTDWYPATPISSSTAAPLADCNLWDCWRPVTSILTRFTWSESTRACYPPTNPTRASSPIPSVKNAIFLIIKKNKPFLPITSTVNCKVPTAYFSSITPAVQSQEVNQADSCCNSNTNWPSAIPRLSSLKRPSATEPRSLLPLTFLLQTRLTKSWKRFSKRSKPMMFAKPWHPLRCRLSSNARCGFS